MKIKNQITFLILIAYFAVSLVMTWPLLSARAGEGFIGNVGDTVFSTYIINWNLHSLITHPGQIWNPGFFFPWKTVLAYSESMLPQSIMALPLLLFTRNPILILNILTFLTFPLAAFFMFLFARYLFQDDSAAFICGLIYGFSLLRWPLLCELQVLSNQWLPLALLFMHKFMNSRKTADLAGLVIFFCLQVLSCLYLGIFLFYALLFLFIFLLFQKKLLFSRDLWIKTASGALVALVIIGIFLWPYFLACREVHHGRTILDCQDRAASFQSFFRCVDYNNFWGKILPRDPDNFWSYLFEEQRLFPGLIPVILLAAGIWPLVFFFRKKIPAEKLYYFFLLIVSVLLTLGPDIKINYQSPPLGPGLYRIFYSWLPGFHLLRFPTRLIIPALLALALLAGAGYQNLARRIRPRFIFLLLISFLILAESDSRPLPLNRGRENLPIYQREIYPLTGQNIPRIYRWLAEQPGDFAILELPIGNWMEDLSYMYYSLFHWKKLVNGHSSFLPPDYWQLVPALKKFPDPDSLKIIRTKKVRYVIVHLDGWSGPDLKKISGNIPGLKEISRFDDDLCFEVTPIPKEPLNPRPGNHP